MCDYIVLNFRKNGGGDSKQLATKLLATSQDGHSPMFEN
jgi:hypothetical protein